MTGTLVLNRDMLYRRAGYINKYIQTQFRTEAILGARCSLAFGFSVDTVGLAAHDRGIRAENG